MKTKVITLLCMISLIMSCQKEENGPQETTTPNDNGGTPTDTTTVDDTTNTSSSLEVKFSIRTIVPTDEVDSIEIVHTVGYDAPGYQYDTLERLIIYPSNLINMGNTLVLNNYNVTGVTDEVPPAYVSGWNYTQDGYEPSSEKYKLTIHYNNTNSYPSTDNLFEFGQSNNVALTKQLTHVIINGHGAFVGEDSY